MSSADCSLISEIATDRQVLAADIEVTRDAGHDAPSVVGNPTHSDFARFRAPILEVADFGVLRNALLDSTLHENLSSCRSYSSAGITTTSVQPCLRDLYSEVGQTARPAGERRPSHRRM